MMKESALVVAPPGLATRMFAVPAVASSPALTWAVTCVGLTIVVGRLAPLQTTEDPPMKLVPFTVSTRGALPAVALVGEIPVKVGALTLNVRAFDVPEGFWTVTTVCPGAARRLPGTTTLICVGLAT